MNVKAPTVIMVSTFGMEEIEERAKEIGIKSFLKKPVTYPVLFDAVKEAFNKEARTKRETANKYSKQSDDLKIIKGATLLLAEDNDINLQVATESLEEVCFVVDTACNGRIAVEKVYPGKYDIVFVDFQMPETDGYDATIEIRKSSIPEQIPIIAITADPMMGKKQKALKL